MPESQAVICHQPGEATIGMVVVPEIGETDVLIRTMVSGISTGTDKWVINGRFEWGGFVFPLVPGYQRIGVVASVGSKVKSARVDDVVFATSSKNFLNATAGWGAHAEWAVSEQREVFQAHDVPRNSGALAVSLQVGVNAASRLTRPQEQRVLVVGDGIIGVSAALAAEERGCEVLLAGHHTSRLTAVTTSQEKISTVNTHEGWKEILVEWAPTAVIDTVQNVDVIEEYLYALPCTWNSSELPFERIGISEVVFAGHSPDGVTSWANMASLQKQETTVHFVSGWTRQRMLWTLGLLRDGRLNLDPFVVVMESSAPEIGNLLSNISSGSLTDVAACIDWSQ